MATPRSVAALEAEMKELVDPSRATNWSRAPGQPWRHRLSDDLAMKQRAGAPPLVAAVPKTQPPIVLAHTPAASISAPVVAPQPAKTEEPPALSALHGKPIAPQVQLQPPATISPIPAEPEGHHHRHHKDKEKHKHRHHHRKQNGSNEVTAAAATQSPPPPAALTSQSTQARIRPYQTKGVTFEADSLPSKALTAETEQRRAQMEEERRLTSQHEQRFMSRRDLKDAVQPQNALSATQLADRLTTLASALRLSLAQLLRVIKNVDEKQALPAEIEPCLPAILLHAGESAALLSGEIKEQLQKAAQEVASCAVNLSALYRTENPDMDLNLTAQRQELKRTIAGLTLVMQGAISQARASAPLSSDLKPVISKNVTRGSMRSASSAAIASPAISPKGESPKPDRRQSAIALAWTQKVSAAPAPPSPGSSPNRSPQLSIKKLSLSKINEPPPSDVPILTRNRAERVRQQKALVPMCAPGMLSESISQGVRVKTSKPGAELWTPSVFFPYEKLKRESGAPCPIPDIDSSKLEAYLKDDEFQKIIGMSKREFYQLPGWRQRAIKINRKLW